MQFSALVVFRRGNSYDYFYNYFISGDFLNETNIMV